MTWGVLILACLWGIAGWLLALDVALACARVIGLL